MIGFAQVNWADRLTPAEHRDLMRAWAVKRLFSDALSCRSDASARRDLPAFKASFLSIIPSNTSLGLNLHQFGSENLATFFCVSGRATCQQHHSNHHLFHKSSSDVDAIERHAVDQGFSNSSPTVA